MRRRRRRHLHGVDHAERRRADVGPVPLVGGDRSVHERLGRRCLHAVEDAPPVRGAERLRVAVVEEAVALVGGGRQLERVRAARRLIVGDGRVPCAASTRWAGCCRPVPRILRTAGNDPPCTASHRRGRRSHSRRHRPSRRPHRPRRRDPRRRPPRRRYHRGRPRRRRRRRRRHRRRRRRATAAGTARRATAATATGGAAAVRPSHRPRPPPRCPRSRHRCRRRATAAGRAAAARQLHRQRRRGRRPRRLPSPPCRCSMDCLTRRSPSRSAARPAPRSPCRNRGSSGSRQYEPRGRRNGPAGADDG